MALKENAENPFTLNYEQQTTVCLVRQGSPEEPIPRDRGLRCMNYSEFIKPQTSNADKRGKDFLLDNKGQIMIEQSSGNNKFLRNLFLIPWLLAFGKKSYYIRDYYIRLDFTDLADSV